MQPDQTLSSQNPAVKNWTGLITQTGTDIPTAIVLRNDLGGTITWARSGVGYYTGTLTGAFTIDKTTFITTPTSGVITIIDIGNEDYPDKFYIATYVQNGVTFEFEASDVLLSNTPLQINVYR